MKKYGLMIIFSGVVLATAVSAEIDCSKSWTTVCNESGYDKYEADCEGYDFILRCPLTDKIYPSSGRGEKNVTYCSMKDSATAPCEIGDIVDVYTGVCSKTIPDDTKQNMAVVFDVDNKLAVHYYMGDGVKYAGDSVSSTQRDELISDCDVSYLTELCEPVGYKVDAVNNAGNVSILDGWCDEMLTSRHYVPSIEELKALYENRYIVKYTTDRFKNSSIYGIDWEAENGPILTASKVDGKFFDFNLKTGKIDVIDGARQILCIARYK